MARVATGMGKPFEKQTRFFALPVATVLADQKANIRAAALQTLSAIAEACDGVESMVHGLTTALESSNPMQRSSLLKWIADWFKGHEPSPSLDLTSWAGPVIASIDDRSADVRKGALAVLPVIVAQAGYDYVIQQTNSLKPAARATVIPLVKAAMPAAAPPVEKVKVPVAQSAPVKTAPKALSPEPASPPPETSASPTFNKAPASKITGVRRKLPQGSIPRPDSQASTIDDATTSRLPAKLGLGGMKRPISVAVPTTRAAAAPSPTLSASAPFHSFNMEAKKARLAKDAGRFIIEAGPVRKDLTDFLHHQMEPHASRELLALLFSHDHNAVNDHVAGLSMLCGFYSNLTSGEDVYGFSPEDRNAVGIANADFAFKYVSTRVHEPQPNLISKCLDVLETVTAFLREANHQLSDPEAMSFVPTLIYKVSAKTLCAAQFFLYLCSWAMQERRSAFESSK